MAPFEAAAQPSPQATRTLVTPDCPADEDLVATARAGSRSAFEALVRRHGKSLYFECFRYVRDHDVAADLSQRAFIRVLENVSELRETAHFRGWLLAIGRNLARNHLRDIAKFSPDATPEVAVSAEAPILVESAEESSSLRRAVSRLSPRQRAVLELRVYDELSFADIARTLDTTANAAKVNFHVATKKLRRWLRPAS